jgi:hypothetical protein
MVSAVNPFLPEPIYTRIRKGIQIASPDVVLDDPYISVESMGDYIFATIGGTEILSATRSDLIDSPLNRNYTAIQDAGTAFTKENAISFNDNSSNTFRGFAIDLKKHVPENNVSHPLIEPELDSDQNPNGNVRINLKDIKPGYYVDVEILTNGNVINGTI